MPQCLTIICIQIYRMRPVASIIEADVRGKRDRCIQQTVKTHFWQGLGHKIVMNKIYHNYFAHPFIVIATLPSAAAPRSVSTRFYPAWCRHVC